MSCCKKGNSSIALFLGGCFFMCTHSSRIITTLHLVDHSKTRDLSASGAPPPRRRIYSHVSEAGFPAHRNLIEFKSGRTELILTFSLNVVSFCSGGEMDPALYTLREGGRDDLALVHDLMRRHGRDLVCPELPEGLEATAAIEKSVTGLNFGWRGADRWVLAFAQTGELVAFAAMRRDGDGMHTFGAPGVEASLSRVFTHPHHRGRGIMKAVLLDQIANAQAIGLRYVRLSVRRGNQTAINFYLSLDFRYYRDNGLTQDDYRLYFF